MNKIDIEFIDGKNQRYKTVGDWYYDEKNPELLHIRISRMSNPQREFLVLVHELVESSLCSQSGISVKEVDGYDLTHPDAGGDEKDMADAPYVKQHGQALTIERMLCHFFGEDWINYEKELDEI